MLLNFSTQFADLVATGAKRQTIRAPRKDGKVPKVGETLFLWTGCRTKNARKLGEHKCIEVASIVIERRVVTVFYTGPVIAKRGDALIWFAKNDGFKDWDEMRTWFDKTHGLPFRGHLIRW